MTQVETASAVTAQRGRTQVARKALDRIVSAISADALGVAPRTPKVELVDSAGDLALVVSSPIRVSALSTSQAGGEPRSRTVLEHAEHAQVEISRRVTEITGSKVASVVIRVTGAEIKDERRVR